MRHPAQPAPVGPRQIAGGGGFEAGRKHKIANDGAETEWRAKVTADSVMLKPVRGHERQGVGLCSRET